MKTYKVIYSIANKPGRMVTFYHTACADFARIKAYDDLGGWGARYRLGGLGGLGNVRYT